MIYLFNTNIIPGEAVVRCREITSDYARGICQRGTIGNDITSAIGHEATAAAMSAIIGKNVPVNRVHAQPNPGDIAISLKVNGRLPEGEILDIVQLREIGFTLYQLEFYGVNTKMGISDPEVNFESAIVREDQKTDTLESVMAHEDPHSQYYGSARDQSTK